MDITQLRKHSRWSRQQAGYAPDKARSNINVGCLGQKKKIRILTEMVEYTFNLSTWRQK